MYVYVCVRSTLIDSKRFCVIPSVVTSFHSNPRKTIMNSAHTLLFVIVYSFLAVHTHALKVAYMMHGELRTFAYLYPSLQKYVIDLPENKAHQIELFGVAYRHNAGKDRSSPFHEFSIHKANESFGEGNFDMIDPWSDTDVKNFMESARDGTSHVEFSPNIHIKTFYIQLGFTRVLGLVEEYEKRNEMEFDLYIHSRFDVGIISPLNIDELYVQSFVSMADIVGHVRQRSKKLDYYEYFFASTDLEHISKRGDQTRNQTQTQPQTQNQTQTQELNERRNLRFIEGLRPHNSSHSRKQRMGEDELVHRIETNRGPTRNDNNNNYMSHDRILVTNNVQTHGFETYILPALFDFEPILKAYEIFKENDTVSQSTKGMQHIQLDVVDILGQDAFKRDAMSNVNMGGNIGKAEVKPLVYLDKYDVMSKGWIEDRLGKPLKGLHHTTLHALPNLTPDDLASSGDKEGNEEGQSDSEGGEEADKSKLKKQTQYEKLKREVARERSQRANRRSWQGQRRQKKMNGTQSDQDDTLFSENFLDDIFVPVMRVNYCPHFRFLGFDHVFYSASKDHFKMMASPVFYRGDNGAGAMEVRLINAMDRNSIPYLFVRNEFKYFLVRTPDLLFEYYSGQIPVDKFSKYHHYGGIFRCAYGGLSWSAVKPDFYDEKEVCNEVTRLRMKKEKVSEFHC